MARPDLPGQLRPDRSSRPSHQRTPTCDPGRAGGNLHLDRFPTEQILKLHRLNPIQVQVAIDHVVQGRNRPHRKMHPATLGNDRTGAGRIRRRHGENHLIQMQVRCIFSQMR